MTITGSPCPAADLSGKKDLLSVKSDLIVGSMITCRHGQVVRRFPGLYKDDTAPGFFVFIFGYTGFGSLFYPASYMGDNTIMK